MSIGDRLRHVRKRLALTMTDFGKPLGLSYDVVSNLERGRTPPSDTVLNLVCYTYHVNRYYLDTGRGEPFTFPDDEDELSAQLRVVLSGMDDFKVNTIIRLVHMPDDWWRQLKDG